MQDVHITCKWDQLQPKVQALEEQFEAQQEEVTILDWGTSYKQEAGYIVLEWEDEVDAAFIDQLTADNDVEDFSVYTVSLITDVQLRIWSPLSWREYSHRSIETITVEALVEK